MGNQYGPRIVTDGLILCLDAGNSKSYSGSGNTWYDLSGNNNNLNLIGNGFDTQAAYSNNNRGILNFNGINDYATIANIQYGDHTISGWIKSQRSSAGTGVNSMTILGNYTATAGSAGKYSVINIDGSAFNWRIDDGALSYRLIASSSFNVNQWYYLSLSYNSNGTCKAYINKNNIGSLNFTPNIIFDSIPFNIAKQQSPIYFEGSIGLCKIYNRALQDNEIIQNYNALKGRFDL